MLAGGFKKKPQLTVDRIHALHKKTNDQETAARACVPCIASCPISQSITYFPQTTLLWQRKQPSGVYPLVHHGALLSLSTAPCPTATLRPLTNPPPSGPSREPELAAGALPPVLVPAFRAAAPSTTADAAAAVTAAVARAAIKSRGTVEGGGDSSSWPSLRGLCAGVVWVWLGTCAASNL